MAAALATSCTPERSAAPTKSLVACGLPSPSPDLDAAAVPDAFVPPGAELNRARRERGGFLAAIGVRMGVPAAFETYLDIVESTGYTLTGRDNEGFEAEIFFKRGRKLGAIQIRMSRCDDVSLAFVQVVDKRFLG